MHWLSTGVAVHGELHFVDRNLLGLSALVVEVACLDAFFSGLRKVIRLQEVVHEVGKAGYLVEKREVVDRVLPLPAKLLVGDVNKDLRSLDVHLCDEIF